MKLTFSPLPAPLFHVRCAFHPTRIIRVNLRATVWYFPVTLYNPILETLIGLCACLAELMHCVKLRGDFQNFYSLEYYLQVFVNHRYLKYV